MRLNVKLPRLADTTDEFVIVGWHVEVGSTVAAGDALADIETDKNTLELPSPVSGVVTDLWFDVGDDVCTGDVICSVEGSSTPPESP